MSNLRRNFAVAGLAYHGTRKAPYCWADSPPRRAVSPMASSPAPGFQGNRRPEMSPAISASRSVSSWPRRSGRRPGHPLGPVSGRAPPSPPAERELLPSRPGQPRQTDRTRQAVARQSRGVSRPFAGVRPQRIRAPLERTRSSPMPGMWQSSSSIATPDAPRKASRCWSAGIRSLSAYRRRGPPNPGNVRERRHQTASQPAARWSRASGAR